MKNNRAPVLYYVKLCASLQSHRWIQTGVTVRKCSIRVKIGDFLFRMTSKFDRWPWKTIEHLFYATLSFVHHFKAIGEFKLKCDLAIWLITLKNKRAHFLCHFKLCASFRSHWIYHMETPNLGQMVLGQVYRDFSLLMIVLDNCVKWNIYLITLLILRTHNSRYM